MKRMSPYILAAVTALVPGFSQAGRHQATVGAAFESWKSNFVQSGSEKIAPFSYRFSSNKLKLRADGAFVSGTYEKAATALSTASKFQGDRLRDTKLGGSYLFKLGAFDSLASIGLNLPTGDEKWEVTQASANTPLIFAPSRYLGRGFGINALYGLGRSTSAFAWNASVGYLMSNAYEPGVSGQELNLGDSIVGSLSLGPKWAKGSTRLGVSLSMPQASKVGGKERFTSASSVMASNRLSLRLSGMALGWNLSYSLYGKGKRLDASGAMAPEASRSLGSRLDFAPGLEYRLGKASLETSLHLKKVFKNGYADASPLHEAGGLLLGLEQGAKFKTGKNSFLELNGLYENIQHEKAALDQNFEPTTVTYDRLAFGANVGLQW